MKMKKYSEALKNALCHIYVNVFARRKYDKRYLTGKYFQKFWSLGWYWAYKDFVNCRWVGVNADVTWPVSSSVRVIFPENIVFDVDDINNFQSFGQYYQAIGKITIGKGTYIGPNVGLITANHKKENLDEHDEAKAVIIGKNCWIGMNSVILPGVMLGDNTIVGAGSIVTKSFSEGHCTIVGNPAKQIKID